MQYTPTIGLEIHAELNTDSKMFCGCKNQPHETEVNANVCPVCLAHPGTLPVANKDAVKMVLIFGQAIAATRAEYSEFDRKNYFYPDIPKAYQISQYQYPFLTGGSVLGVELTRVHLEEDTARSSHEQIDGSVVDFNRAGVPLMELVTEPVLHDSKSAGAFARELQLILQTLRISKANMERGEMRIEANISVSTDPEKMSTKYVEVKNINSFKAVEAAIEYEIVRQTELLESGGELVQETRGWDENKSQTFSQRTKETAKEYRYFPDPDLPKMQLPEVAEFTASTLTEKIPMLPEKKRILYSKTKISSKIIETIISDKDQDNLFNSVYQLTKEELILKLAANYISVDMAGLQADGKLLISEIDPKIFLELMELIQVGDIGSRNAKNLLPELPLLKGSLKDNATERGWLQQSDEGALVATVKQVVAENPDQVTEFKSGKETVLKYLVGQGMKLSKGSANPEVLSRLLVAEITK